MGLFSKKEEKKKEAIFLSSMVDEDETVKIIGEVVGGFRLGTGDAIGSSFDEPGLVADKDEENSSVEPYVFIKFGNRILHRTKKADGGTSPIWTLSTKSLFIWEATPRELAQNDLHVSVWYKQKDPLNITTLQTVFMGKADISSVELISNHCDEERMEIDLESEDGCATKATITMRFRLATPSDEDILEKIYAEASPDLFAEAAKAAQKVTKQDQMVLTDNPWTEEETPGRTKATIVTEIDETKLLPSNFVNALSTAFTRKTYMDRGISKRLVKPCPDPSSPTETHISAEDVKGKTMQPSRNWVEAGSGDLGTLYLEILKCDDLPNVDVGEAVGNVTDAFICAIFEDVMVQTPVIDDELCPHWLPWTQRAFKIGIMHPASMLYLGAFDFDFGLSDHDPLGRVSVNVSNLQHDTDYTLTYNLYPSSNVTDRTSAGTITIRVRLEYNDEKAALMKALSPRPKFYVNVNKEKSLKVVRYTCFGEYGDEESDKFDLTVLRSYINELLGYKNAVIYCIGDAIKSLIFWRGQVQLGGMYIPLHSFILFMALSTLIEKPYLAPPFTILAIGWMMIANLTQRRQHPSPWARCPSFLSYLEILRTGKSPVDRNYRIEPGEGVAETEAYEKAWKERLEKDAEEAAAAAARQQHIEKVGDDAIQTKMTALIPIDLLDRLGRYQGILGRLTRQVRYVKIITTWEEGIVSFKMTAFLLAAGCVMLLLPWAFILTWTSRFVVYTFLGPHMMLVDVFLKDRHQDETTLAKALEKFQAQSLSARNRRQDALKLKDTKSLAFGKYLTMVPNFNLSRHSDFPMPASFAAYRKRTEATPSSAFVQGQHFHGVIVPRTHAQRAQHAKELEEVMQLQPAVATCVKAIRENEGGAFYLTNKPVLSEEENIGYELIAINEDGKLDNDTGKNNSRPVSPSNVSVHVDSERRLAVVPTKQGLPKRPESCRQRKPTIAKISSVGGIRRRNTFDAAELPSARKAKDLDLGAGIEVVLEEEDQPLEEREPMHTVDDMTHDVVYFASDR